MLPITELLAFRRAKQTRIAMLQANFQDRDSSSGETRKNLVIIAAIGIDIDEGSYNSLA